MSRQPITPELLQAMGAELADVPASGERATAHAATFEALMAMITQLRTLPLKDVEPAVIYAPEELRR